MKWSPTAKPVSAARSQTLAELRRLTWRPLTSTAGHSPLPSRPGQVALDMLHQVLHYEPLLRADVHARPALAQVVRHHRADRRHPHAGQTLTQRLFQPLCRVDLVQPIGPRPAGEDDHVPPALVPAP